MKKIFPIEPNNSDRLSKPSWIKIKLPTNLNKINEIQNKILKNNLHSVCQEASCPNLSKCFNQGTATFMILGNICTRNCPFCDVTHGRPIKPNNNESVKLAKTIHEMKLFYVVITSVNRDDLHDGGAQYFADCIKEIRFINPVIKIEILVPDFRGCMEQALAVINNAQPDIFSHNIENVPRLYHNIRPGANYYRSLKLLKRYKEYNPTLPTKSGIMVGLGETNLEIIEVMKDLRDHGVTMLTIGQYLPPSRNHLPVKRYMTIPEFEQMKQQALSMGFTYAACGPFVRSSYNAELQAKGTEVK